MRYFILSMNPISYIELTASVYSIITYFFNEFF